MRVCVIGGTNADIIATSFKAFVPGDSNPGTVRLTAGGVGRNIAHNLALLGDEVVFLTVFGGDDLGHFTAESCRKAGIDISLCDYAAPGTRSCFLSINDCDGEMVGGVADMVAAEGITPVWLASKMGKLGEIDVYVADANIPVETLVYLIDHANKPLYVDAVSGAKAAKIKEAMAMSEKKHFFVETRKDASVPKYAEFVADRPFLYVISEQSTGAIFFIGQYMGETLKNVRKDISLSEEEKQLVESNNGFALNLFRKARGDKSSIMSPLSITYALGMMNNGAAGQTQQEINEVLGFGDAGADAINAFCSKLLTEAPTLDETTAAEIANTVFVNSGKDYHLQQGFIDKANAFYDAEPMELNFYDKQNTIDIINGWANDHTHGMIPILFDDENSFNADAVSYLLNALYFKGAWTNKFDKNFTQDEPFAGGQTVPMMQQRECFQYTENDLYQAVRLPYGNEAYSMTVFLPREDKGIDEVLDQMNSLNIDFPQWTENVDLKLPRIQTGTSLPLVDVMKELGMIQAFDESTAEFPYFGNRDVFISNMFQKAAIDLDEEGTEAAAVTVIEYESTGISHYATFHATRPFFYTISEQSTGAIFFVGQYTGPDTASPVSLTPSLSKGEEAIYNLSGQRIGSIPQHGIYIKGNKKVLK